MISARPACVLATLATSLACAAPASAAGLLATQVTLPDAVARDCQAALLPAGGGDGYVQKAIALPTARPAGRWRRPRASGRASSPRASRAAGASS